MLLQKKRAPDSVSGATMIPILAPGNAPPADAPAGDGGVRLGGPPGRAQAAAGRLACSAWIEYTSRPCTWRIPSTAASAPAIVV